MEEKAEKRICIIAAAGCSVLCLLLWYFGLTLRAAESALFTDLGLAYGKAAEIGIKVLGVMIFLSIIVLPIVLRNKNPLIGSVAAIAFTVIYFQFFIHLHNVAVIEFTPEKWQAYPAERGVMYEDFLKKYKIEGMDSGKVDALLGEPDFIDDSGAYIYRVKFGYIEMNFENGKVSRSELIDTV